MTINALLSSTVLGLLVALCVTVQGLATEVQATFPGREAECAGPGGHYVVVNVDPDVGRDPEAPHQLFLHDRLRNQKFKLLDYRRSVGVLWSPNGKSLAITDHAGSNLSNAYVFLLESGIRRIDIGEEFRRNAGSAAAVPRNHHAYLEATKWLDDTKLLVRLHGYEDENPDGFELIFEYTIEGGFQAVGTSEGSLAPNSNKVKREQVLNYKFSLTPVDRYVGPAPDRSWRP